jgi:uncharacterized protein YaaR (DUF327 family)
MPKVDFPEGSFLNPGAYTAVKAETKKTQDKSKLRGAKGVPFSRVMEDASEKTEGSSASEALRSLPVSEETLRDLLDQVHSSGEELKGRPFPEEIKKYKSAVRDFLHYVVENGYSVVEQTSGVNILKRKKFTLIQVVDSKLERLAAGIMAGQSSQLDILAKVDEIAGLLVDLLR